MGKGDRHGELPEFAFASKSTATAYRFTASSMFGWAICTINDETCELAVQSDWGAWAHRWPAAGLTGTLTEFIAQRTSGEYEGHYLADKLCSREQRERFSPGRTVDSMQRRIIERRREGHATRDRARELYDHAEYLRDTDDMHDFVAEMDFSETPDWVFDRCEDIQMEPTNSYLILRDAILPALIRATRGETKT